MICKKDSKPILIKFPIGISKSTKTDKIYESNWNTIYGLVSDPSGSLNSFVYGNNEQFDRIIILNATSVTRQIDYDTIFMIDDMPTQNYPKGDYAPKYIYPEYNGQIRIGLNKTESINKPKLYFFKDNQLLFVQMNFDSNLKCAYINKNKTIPFNLNTYVYTREPSNQQSTTGRLLYSSVSKAGYDDSFKPFNKLTFSEVNS